jgi:HlyD family secretion protein
MRRLLKIIVGLLVLGVAGWLAIPPLCGHWLGHHKPSYREAAVTRGEIIAVVNSTGTVKPVLNVAVGAVVSGPIKAVHVDFNAQVKVGQLMAEIDPVTFKAQVTQAQAALDCASANLLQAQAKLAQAKQEWQRAESLRPIKAISDTDYDLAQANYSIGKANEAVCQATIAQQKGSLEFATTNLAYTKIKSPVDGVVIDRKVDPGQSVASLYQTPEMFKVAPELDKRVFVYASVDEADIGLIRGAQDREEPVMFTVDAYPNDLFEGKVYQVRLNPTTTQNVVTYPVVVEAPNCELKLLPGMTASLSFQIDKHTDVLRVPNAALRFFPKAEEVRSEDRGLLEGGEEPKEDDEEHGAANVQRSAMEKAETARKRNRRHVWIVEGDLLRAVEIVIGLSDEKFSEVVSGALEEKQNVVTGTALSKP